MLQLSRPKNSDSAFVVHNIHYHHLYDRLSRVLPQQYLRFFSKPDIGETYTLWYLDLDNASGKSFGSLNEEEKKWAIAEIRDRKEDILRILRSQEDPEYRRIANAVFLIPEENDIKVIQTLTERFVCFTRWGCKSNLLSTETNPMVVLLDRYPDDRLPVVLDIRYTDEEPADSLPFSLLYKTVHAHQSDEKGMASVGRFLPGSRIEVFFNCGEEERYRHVFTVAAGAEYPVRVPRLGSLTLSVVDENQEPLTGVPVQIRYKGQDFSYKTDAKGQLVLDYLERPEQVEIEVRTKNGAHADTLIRIEEAENEAVLRLIPPPPLTPPEVFARLQIFTVDAQGQPVPNVALQVRCPQTDQLYECSTDDQGFVSVNGVFKPGQELEIKAPALVTTLFKHSIEAEDSKLILKLFEGQPPHPITVKLVNHKSEPLPGQLIDFKGKSLETSRTTDEQALCTFDQADFVDKERVRAKVYYATTDKKGRKRTRIYNKKFQYKTEQTEYLIRLTRRRWWWLLLLLPLLLLIQCNKTVYLKVMDAETGQLLSDVHANMDYSRHDLFRPWGFFTDRPEHLQDTTDAGGVAVFAPVRYSLYSWLFYGSTPARFSAGSDCHYTGSMETPLHGIRDTVVLRLASVFETVEFLVVDKSDNEPLPQAMVRVEYAAGGTVRMDSMLSDPEGKVRFSLPKCVDSVHIRADKWGYYPDSLMNKTLPDLDGALEDKRKLRLQPIKAKLRFFVEDCDTKKRIPGATVTIEVIGKGKSQQVITNVNGVGKGEYDDANLIDEVSFRAEHPDYFPGTLPIHKVRDFINLPEKARTICLKRKPLPPPPPNPPRPLPDPCYTKVDAGQDQSSMKEYDMTGANPKVTVRYDMFGVPDRMIVYCGRINGQRTKIHDTGFVPDKGGIPIDWSKCGSSWITVEIIKNPTGSTAWQYSIDCH